ncbi:MAG: TrkA family potassium uptake protein [Nitrospirae bacterium]|nr:TrkA family potassium uptake protein [Nitrospirota bacterium]
MRQVAVIGLGRFGFNVAETLIKKGCEVLAIDRDETKIEAVSDFATYAVECDAADEKALKAISAQNVDAAVVSIGENIEASILIVMALKDLGVKEIIAKAVTPTHGKVLENLGVSRVVYPERDAAIRLAHSLIAPNVLEYLELSPGYSIAELPVPAVLAGQTLKGSQLRTRHGISLIGIRKKVTKTVKGVPRTEEVFNLNPSADDRLESGEIMVVIGTEENLDRLSKL